MDGWMFLRKLLRSLKVCCLFQSSAERLRRRRRGEVSCYSLLLRPRAAGIGGRNACTLRLSWGPEQRARWFLCQAVSGSSPAGLRENRLLKMEQNETRRTASQTVETWPILMSCSEIKMQIFPHGFSITPIFWNWCILPRLYRVYLAFKNNSAQIFPSECRQGKFLWQMGNVWIFQCHDHIPTICCINFLKNSIVISSLCACKAACARFLDTS